MNKLWKEIRRLGMVGFASALLSAQIQPPSTAPAPSGYVLGPDDQISIRVLQAPELIDKPVRIDSNGYIDLPYIGRVKAAGSTPETLKKELKVKFQAIVRDPELSVSIDEFRSQPVSVIGAVNTPGVVQIRGRKSLLEVLSLAGGLRQDSGNTITVTRQQEYGALGLRGEASDASGRYLTAKVDLSSLMEGRTPYANVQIQPNDVVAVSRAHMVYVLGDVSKAGGFVLSERDGVSILEALALGGGANRTAALRSARILRASAGEPHRNEVTVDIQKILDGKERDWQLNADDVLFVPSSTMKRVSARALEAALQIGTGLAIWRP
jgi:polysaccharide export outer membrane protein